jgi:hypothetical protein
MVPDKECRALTDGELDVVAGGKQKAGGQYDAELVALDRLMQELNAAQASAVGASTP